MIIFVSFLRPRSNTSRAELPKNSTDWTVENKNEVWIIFTLAGIVTCFNGVTANAVSPISTKPSFNFTSVKPDLTNAYLDISFTEPGISIVDKLTQAEKASEPISLIESGNLISDIGVFENMPIGIISKLPNSVIISESSNNCVNFPTSVESTLPRIFLKYGYKLE